ncbi:P-loop containing nucleoside triphosphate hydrolase protein, partial [Baffinella frigidus]
MKVFYGVRVVGMAPCDARGGSAGRGTVLELHARAAVRALPMFGSLIALAHGSEFGDATWATVAASERKQGADGAILRLFVELSSDLNADASDASLLALLLRRSGQLTLVQSPTFYRAYGPALEVLQSLEEERMPFLQEVVLGEEGPAISLTGRTVDYSLVFSPAEPSSTEEEDEDEDEPMAEDTVMDAPTFCSVLDRLSRAPPSADGTLAWGARRTTLDPSQCAALLDILTRRVAVIQGPPGTGKTFTAVRAVQLLASLSPPLDQREKLTAGLVLALDDFLLGCLRIWPNGVARIGGQPKAGSPLEHRHVHALMRTAGGADPEMASTRRGAEELSERVQAAATALSERRYFSAETMLAAPGKHLASLVLNDATKTPKEVAQARSELQAGDRGTLLKHAAHTLRAWMPSTAECATFCPKPVAPDRALGGGGQGGGAGEEEQDDVQRDRRAYVSFDRTTVELGKAPGAHARAVLELRSPLGEVEAADLLATEDLWSLRKGETRAYILAVEKLRREEVRQQGTLLRNFKVVGMTISGAAIHRDVLEELRPSCVLVEEAAETLEPLLLAALGPWVQRLILIGDHKQLPPAVEDHLLSRHHFFDTSLMERFIANRLPHVVLAAQARMMPEFAALLTSVYPTLRTSARVAVENRASPQPGCAASMFYWDTCGTCGEASNDGASIMNEGEACAVVALAVHLIRSGVAPERITILAPYAAQVERVKRILAREVPKVSQLGWPSEHMHGKVAAAQAAALEERRDSGRALPADQQLCLAIAETFLKLGRIPPAAHLLQRA